jgi:hypothetical protein
MVRTEDVLCTGLHELQAGVVDVVSNGRAVTGHHGLNQSEYNDKQQKDSDADCELVLEESSPYGFPVGIAGRCNVF